MDYFIYIADDFFFLCIGLLLLYLFILAVAHLDDAVVISRPVVTFGGIAERTYVRFSLVQPVEVVLVVFKGHLCKVVRTAYPEDALV
jgi:hypothetical protein